ncbi:xanthine dehydrogenase accessory protein XdhC [Octadecabacter sp. G9-8]|uniref:Xanthine dehydrogenase accessory protein XdhC n=1 Tax=Octadecabacter dasysiphoniae TaxID=2909341 RepID=A0ABS9CQZ8_9RHOB|nr:xanthine dehydrogenase accessory protein XdhC [Octadecabacter dasysiphoniae]MCF2869663.1 xanthine dehydrogenase accessory protein XdhC [Octadecabacter dasysiphoniae]
MNDWIRVRVQATKGSAPRDTDAQMFVFEDVIEGTIGGGALEWDAIHTARDMLLSGQTEATRNVALGPDMGQCCGGRVTLDYARNVKDEPPLGTPLWIWGAGHVGRAIAHVMAPFNDREITLIDTSVDRMPDNLAPNVAPLVAADPARVVARAPERCDHIIVTYSHDLDLALCDALLRHGFASCGIIGSATKWARFRSRLASMGHGGDEITRIACPIGEPRLGKHPQAIAVGVAAALISSSAGATGKANR